MTQLRRILCFAVFGAALLFLPGKAADAALGQQESPLTNADVISMVKSGLPEAVIIGSIKTSENNFDTSAKALIALQKASVPQKVMQAMIDAAAAKKNATAAAAPVAGAALTPPAQSTTSLGASTAMPAGGVANPSPLPSGRVYVAHWEFQAAPSGRKAASCTYTGKGIHTPGTSPGQRSESSIASWSSRRSHASGGAHQACLTFDWCDSGRQCDWGTVLEEIKTNTHLRLGPARSDIFFLRGGGVQFSSHLCGCSWRQS